MSDIDDCRKSVERLTRDRGEVMREGNDKIEEIRARHEDNASIGSIIYGPDRPPSWTLVGWKAHHDRAFLLLELDRLRASLSWYADQRNHLPVERRNPGDPDPAVIILDEPPILIDGGTLARIALEGKR